MTNLWKRERGQALVELAMLLPVLLIILLGVIDFGRVFFAYVTITNASREGARYGSLNPLAADTFIEERVIAEAANMVTIAPEDIGVFWTGGVPGHPDTITVTVNHEFPTLFFGNLPYIRDWFPAEGKIPITGQAEMRVAP